MLTLHHGHCWVGWASPILENALRTSHTELAVVEPKLLNNPSLNWQYASWNVRLKSNQYWLLSTSIVNDEITPVSYTHLTLPTILLV